ncbi:MAG: hypothetical protein OHK0013_36680 [Sandaracinaceae bacterium]
MASKNVSCARLAGVVGILAALTGCPSDPQPTRPDAAIGTDSGTGGTDTGPMMMGSDAGVDAASTTRVCRSPMGACDLLAQDCADPMQTCVYALPEAGATAPQTVCAPIVGAGAEEGQPCCALNSCDEGLACVGAVETVPGSGMCTTMGVCRRYCCGSNSDCEPGQICNGFGSTAGFMGGICDTSDDCNLVSQTGCEGMPGTGCYPSMGTVTQCVTPTAAMADEGETCMFTNDCVPGTACFTITPGGGGMSRQICLRFCDLADGAADCPNSGGMACQSGGTLPTGVGICPPPAG